MQRLTTSAFLLLAACAPLAHGADQQTPESTVTVGAGIAVVPEYLGSDKTKTRAIIGIDYQNKNGFFASTQRGIGYGGKTGAFGYSAAVGHAGARYDRDRSYGSGSDALRGMGEIEASAVALLGASYDFGGVSVSAKGVLAMTRRERGNHYEFGVQLPLLTNEKNRVGMFASTDYSDRKHMQAFHGVTAAQSKASGFKAYTPDAGFSKVTLGANWKYQINKAWSLNNAAGAVHLVGDAADSPLTKRKTSPFLMSTVNYAF